MRHAACGIVLALSGLAAGAEPPEAQQRERIVAERAQAAVTFAEQEQACRARFVVSACLEAVRKAHGATLARLRREEIQLGEARRRASAAARNAAVRDKAAAQQARSSDAPAIERGAARRSPPLPNPPRAAASQPARPIAAQRVTEQRNEAKYEARLREAQAHREAVERRNAERAAQGKAAAPLPVQAGASAH